MIEFKAAMQSAGLEAPDRIEPGTFHRFPGIGKRNGNKAGWCRLFPDIMGGTYGDYSTGLSESWQAERDQPRTEAERAAFRRQVEESRKQVAALRQKEQEAAATRAAQIWQAALPAPADHLYLKTKSVQAHGLRLHEEALVIPLRDEAGTLCSLQFISSDGEKRFLTEGKKKGCYASIGSKPEKFLCIAEGYATAATIHEATGHPVAVALDAGNLEPVALALHAKRPDLTLIICADDDYQTEGNPGITKATKAAAAVNGLVAVPDFGLDRQGGMTDFNDLARHLGLDSVKTIINGACAEQSTPDEPTPVTVQNVEQEGPEATIQHLASLSPIEYEQARKDAATGLKIRATILDKVVNDTRKGNTDSDLPFEETAPWPAPIDPARLLTDIAATIQRFIVCSKDVSNTVALWSAMTWFMEVVQVAPLAVITAPEKRCGKSLLLSLLGRLSARSISASSISPAALYRAIDAWKPTLLIDEADAFMKDNEELRGIINSGHTRDLAYVIRTVGENFTPAKFNTWGAKAIAGIGHVADTLMDRAVILELRRKLPDEKVERVRYAEPTLFDDLRAKLARFSGDYSDQVRQARPYLPPSLNDRAQDNWEPLLAIAMIAGGDWLDIGTTAALKLSGGESAAQTVGTELLADIKEIFEMKNIDRITSVDLIKALCDDEEKPWATYNRGFPIKPRQISTRLKGYGLTVKTIRVNSVDTAKGYEKKQFNEAFSRYIHTHPHPPDLSVTRSQPSSTGPSRVTDSTSVTVTGVNVTDSNPVSDVTLLPIEEACYSSVTDTENSNSLFSCICDRVTDRATLPGSSIVEVVI